MSVFSEVTDGLDMFDFLMNVQIDMQNISNVAQTDFLLHLAPVSLLVALPFQAAPSAAIQTPGSGKRRTRMRIGQTAVSPPGFIFMMAGGRGISHPKTHSADFSGGLGPIFGLGF